MTDNEVIKALECCKKRYNGFLCTNDCPVYNKCISVVPPEELIEGALNLIIQQKAENEGLESRISALNDTNKMLMDSQEIYWKNKVQEFAEKVKQYRNDCPMNGKEYICVDIQEIDNLAKEMKGVNENDR